MAIGSARENTFDLLLDKTDLGMQLLETRVRGQLDPVMTAATQIGEMLAGGRLEPTNRGAIIATFRGALAYCKPTQGHRSSSGGTVFAPRRPPPVRSGPSRSGCRRCVRPASTSSSRSAVPAVSSLASSARWSR